MKLLIIEDEKELSDNIVGHKGVGKSHLTFF